MWGYDDYIYLPYQNVMIASIPMVQTVMSMVLNVLKKHQLTSIVHRLIMYDLGTHTDNQYTKCNVKSRNPSIHPSIHPTTRTYTAHTRISMLRVVSRRDDSDVLCDVMRCLHGGIYRTPLMLSCSWSVQSVQSLGEHGLIWFVRSFVRLWLYVFNALCVSCVDDCVLCVFRLMSYL